MKRVVIHLPHPAYWKVTMLLSYECGYIDELMAALIDIDCPDDILDKAYIQASTCEMNLGLTYSNAAMQQSVVVVGRTSSTSEFANTLVHELYHVIDIVMQTYDIDIHSEQAAYLFGDTMMMMFDKAHEFICKACHK